MRAMRSITILPVLALVACLGQDEAEEADGEALIEAVASGETAMERIQLQVGEFTFDATAAGPVDGELVFMLHGFPQSSYEFRNQIPAVAEMGFRVVAPDQRGYGRTTGWSREYDDDLAPFRFLNLMRDVYCLVDALGYESVAAVVGHDFGSPVAADCALIRPDAVSYTHLTLPTKRIV